MSKLITVPIREDVEFYEFWGWCKQYCQGIFYTGTNWNLNLWQVGKQNRIVQFENEQDAIMFALRWS